MCLFQSQCSSPITPIAIIIHPHSPPTSSSSHPAPLSSSQIQEMLFVCKVTRTPKSRPSSEDSTDLCLPQAPPHILLRLLPYLHPKYRKCHLSARSQVCPNQDHPWRIQSWSYRFTDLCLKSWSPVLHLYHPPLSTLDTALHVYILVLLSPHWPVKPQYWEMWMYQGAQNCAVDWGNCIQSCGGCCNGWGTHWTHQPVSTHLTHHTCDQYPLAQVWCKGQGPVEPANLWQPAWPATPMTCTCKIPYPLVWVQYFMATGMGHPKKLMDYLGYSLAKWKAWAAAHAGGTVEDWKQVIFSDELKFMLFKSDGHQYSG